MCLARSGSLNKMLMRSWNELGASAGARTDGIVHTYDGDDEGQKSVYAREALMRSATKTIADTPMSFMALRF
jgi:hypothetical protein